MREKDTVVVKEGDNRQERQSSGWIGLIIGLVLLLLFLAFGGLNLFNNAANNNETDNTQTETGTSTTTDQPTTVPTPATDDSTESTAPTESTTPAPEQ